MATPTAIVGYLLLFTMIGFLFLLVSLLAGKLVRPREDHEEKLEIYECGEPAIGSSFVQFDLRFYVVALVFIVFDVEVAFLFPLATVYGKATNLMEQRVQVVATVDGGQVVLTADARAVYRELGVSNPTLVPGLDEAEATAVIRDGSRTLAWTAFWAINVFFFVLLVGFFYEWKTGAFDWVRAVRRERALRVERSPPALALEEEAALAP